MLAGVVQVQDDQQEDVICLELVYPFDDKGHVKICLCGASPILVYGGSSCESSPSEVQSRKVVHLKRSRSSTSSSSGMRKAKV